MKNEADNENVADFENSIRLRRLGGWYGMEGLADLRYHG